MPNSNTIINVLEDIYKKFESSVIDKGVNYRKQFLKGLSEILVQYNLKKVDRLSIQMVICGVCDGFVSEAAKKRRIWEIDFEPWKEEVIKSITENLGGWYLNMIFNRTPCSTNQK